MLDCCDGTVKRHDPKACRSSKDIKHAKYLALLRIDWWINAKRYCISKSRQELGELEGRKKSKLAK